MSQASLWPHQVELKLDAGSAAERLRRIKSWCADWQIRVRVHEPMASGTILKVTFDDPRFAKAFHAHFGGVIMPVNDVERAMAADAHDEDECDRLAREFPEDG